MKLLSLGLGLLGAFVGSFLGRGFGLVGGALIGYVIGELHELKRRLRSLEQKNAALAAALHAPGPQPTEAPLAAGTGSGEAAGAELFVDFPEPVAAAETQAAPVYVPDPEPPHPGRAYSPAALGNLLLRYFTGGNMVVRVGVIILFFGVAFLIKYATDHRLLPIDLRLAGAAVCGMIMLAIGWRLRGRRIGYALTLQGGGIGVLYLTVFGAAKIYGLVSPFFALLTLIVLVALSGVLAVLQDARSLALLGAAGGFLAPVLISTGSKNHVMLFAYYLVLNSGVLGIAWFKSWRELNLLGFVFTFGIGAVWGLSYYRPPYFSSTEPFLVVFFLMYLLVAVLFAHRQPLQLKGYVDGTLVFALPLAVFALQSGLVRRMEYGLAFSAVALAAVYIGTATLLWRREREGMRLLTEAFLALGIMFATLAVPLATNGHWTAGAWALEGAALVWVGVRQRRILSRSAGILLQAASGLAALYAIHAAGDTALMSGVLISTSALFSSWYLERRREVLTSWETHLPTGLMVWGLSWWFGAAVHKLDRQLPSRYVAPAVVSHAALSLGLMGWVARRLDWRSLRFPPMGLLPLMVIAALQACVHGFYAHPLRDGWWAAWAIAFAVFYFLLRIHEKRWNRHLLHGFHLVGCWLAVFLVTREIGWALERFIHGEGTWRFVGWGLVPALFTLTLSSTGHRWPWPVKPYRHLYQSEGLAALVVYLLGWCIVSAAHAANPAPLGYFPLLNPIDLMVAFAVLLAVKWSTQPADGLYLKGLPIPGTVQAVLLGLVVVLCLSATLARTVHFWNDVPFRLDALARSTLFQASLSVLWSLIAMGVMGVATRRQLRPIWFGGAGLIGVVVVKLFIMDLSGSGTIARIVSFLAVGALMLIIGYFSPLPPNQIKGQEQHA